MFRIKCIIGEKRREARVVSVILFVVYYLLNNQRSNNLSVFIRIFSYSILALTFVFLINNVLTVWFDWPGLKQLFAHHGLYGFKKLSTPLDDAVLNLCYIQLSFYFISFILFFWGIYYAKYSRGMVGEGVEWLLGKK